MTRQFSEDREFGQLGQRYFVELVEDRGWGEAEDVAGQNQSWDFNLRWGKKTTRCEVKTCGRIWKTRNVLVEVARVHEDGTVGPGWVSTKKKLWDELWYYSPRESLFRVYDYQALLQATMREYRRKGWKVMPKTQGYYERWQSRGILVPAASVVHSEYAWPRHDCRPWLFESEGQTYPIHWWGWSRDDVKWDSHWPHYQGSRDHAVERGCPPEDLARIPLWGRYKGERRA